MDLSTPDSMSMETKLHFARLELRRDIKQCTINGYKRSDIKALGEKMKAFQTDFAGMISQQEIETMAEILKALIRHMNEAEQAAPVAPTPTAAKTDLERDVPLRQASSPMTGELSNTAVINSKNFYQDNVLLLYSPFAEELDYIAECYAYEKNMPIRIFDMESLISNFKDETSNLIFDLHEHCKNTKEVIVYKNVEAMSQNNSVEENFHYYLRLMRVNCPGIIQLILASSTTYNLEDRYREFITKTYKSSGSIQTYLKSIPFDFVPLPTKLQTLSVLRQKFVIDEGTPICDEVSKNGIFLGYKGVSRLMSSVISNEELSEKLSEAKKANKKLLDDFLTALGNRNSLDISDWKYTAKAPKAQPVTIDTSDDILRPKYKMRSDGLYDSLMGNDEIYRKLELIMNYQSSGITTQAKCAWVADFAMKGGDMLNLFNIPPEEAENILAERWNIAYRAVAELMRVEVGTMIFDIPENSTLLGQCCDGGATIRMNKKYVKVSTANIDEGIDTILHELFHALQHRAINADPVKDNDLLSYYTVHFGVRLQIPEWKKNFSRYRSTDKGQSFADYEDQVVEAEARIFAADCIWKNGMIDHPILN